ncbi:MAG: DNA photolyase [Methylothermaceae bacteria B42]|nr:MAG: DNA photolyase [Methylothermaceae bacteria B42]HHJ38712.1 DNA photolyase [Methylothermaceae bacterium]
MIETIYIDSAAADHPRTRVILQRFPGARKIECEHYGEVFNPKAQNFRLQKHRPALILARKSKNLVLEAPIGYNIGGVNNFYFSHMLNCLYDCRYCFLQGMYRSANYVLFVNYEDFEQEIIQARQRLAGEPVYFFSGYDCDSLALEPVTGFIQYFLDTFKKLPDAWLEIRTKSTQIRMLLEHAPMDNIITAFSFTPAPIARALEHRVPSVEKRLAAMAALQEQGWPLGLRFDPLIYQEDYRQQYRDLFSQIFKILHSESLHSVSLGVFRLPEKYFARLRNLYPDEPLFAGPLERRERMVAYRHELEAEMIDFCRQELLHYLPETKLFSCQF